MRTIFILMVLISALLNVGCKTISVAHETQKTTTQNKIIGTFGKEKGFILKNNYSSLAIPNYNKPIKLNVSVVTFSKHSFKVFTKAKEAQLKNITINYSDSIAKKPIFLKLEIADRIEVLKALHHEENKEIFEFLKLHKNAHMISSISIAFNINEFSNITQADEVFLEQSGIKNYVIKTYKKGKLQQTFQFNEGIVFAYQKSYACWKQNDTYQLEIVDLSEKKTQCPTKTFTTSKRAKKKINYFKL